MQYPKDPATPPADHAPEGAQGAHETSFAGDAPQSPVSEPEPFTELENLYAENASLKERVLRTLAEMENLRRRTDREVADAKTYGVTSFAREMLTLADNLRRGLETLTPEARAAADPTLVSFIEGVELTERAFLSSLSRQGVKKIDPQGQRFDPNMHEALFEAPDASVPNGTVVQVVETGYSIGERCLRPAKVGVSRGGPKAVQA
jgi:molecular chaperone GrpE